MPSGRLSSARGGNLLRRLFTARLTLDDLWLLIPPALLFVWLGIETIHPSDFWWHLRTGQVIVQTGRVPTVDLFTFTRAGQPWTDQAWLSQVALYLLYEIGNLPLILLCIRVVIVAGYALVEAACLQDPRTGARSAALAAVYAMILGHLNWGVRPQAVSFLGFGMLVYVLERHRARGGRIIWVLPPLFALWSNMHGAFAFALVLLGTYIVSRVAGDLLAAGHCDRGTLQALLAGISSVLVLSLNPYGPIAVYRYLLGLLQSTPIRDLVQEWAPLSIRERDGLLFVAALVVWFALLYGGRRKLAAYDLATLGLFGLLSLYARRILPWYGMATAPALAVTVGWHSATVAAAPTHRDRNHKLHLPCSHPSSRDRQPALGAALLPRFREGFSFLDTRWTPVTAGQELCGMEADPRAFSDIAYASYLIWACPTAPVFMDTRFELYPADMWKEYLLVANGQYGWEDVLRRYGIDAILADREEQEILIKAAQATGAWLTKYEDSHTALLVRK